MDNKRYVEVFANNTYFEKVYTMDSKRKSGDDLKRFFQEFGVPYNLTFDGSKEHACKETKFMKRSMGKALIITSVSLTFKSTTQLRLSLSN